MKITPIQIYEKVLTPQNQFTNYFQIWFRDLFQYVKESQTIVSASPSYQYCLNGNLLTINYFGSGEEINLPYKIAENQIINYWDSDVLKKLEISKNDLKIIVPNGVIKFTCTIMVRVN